MKKFTTILNTAYAALQHAAITGNYSPRNIIFRSNFLFYQREYENIIYNFYKEKYPWYPGPSLISKPAIGLIIKQKNSSAKYMIMKMEKLKDNEYNCYVCYLPNCGEDYKEGDIVEIPEWIKRKYKL